MDGHSIRPVRPGTEERKELEDRCRRSLRDIDALRQKLPGLQKRRRNARIRSGIVAGFPSVLLFGLLAVIYGWLVALMITCVFGLALWKIASHSSGADVNIAAFAAELERTEDRLKQAQAQLRGVRDS
jgi:type IV secretory pathway TrbD component